MGLFHDTEASKLRICWQSRARLINIDLEFREKALVEELQVEGLYGEEIERRL